MQHHCYKESINISTITLIRLISVFHLMWFSIVLSWQTCYFWIAAPTKKTENGVKYRFDLPVNARKWVIRPKTKQKRGCSQTKWGNQFCISYICQTSQYFVPEWEQRCTIEGRSLGHSDQSSPDR